MTYNIATMYFQNRANLYLQHNIFQNECYLLSVQHYKILEPLLKKILAKASHVHIKVVYMCMYIDCTYTYIVMNFKYWIILKHYRQYTPTAHSNNKKIINLHELESDSFSSSLVPSSTSGLSSQCAPPQSSVVNSIAGTSEVDAIGQEGEFWKSSWLDLR